MQPVTYQTMNIPINNASHNLGQQQDTKTKYKQKYNKIYHLPFLFARCSVHHNYSSHD